MKIRKADQTDLNDIMKIYDHAKKFMRENGNLSQWTDGYPSCEQILSDIEKGICYVCLKNGNLTGVFVFFIGEDPTYHTIREGTWNYEKTYGVIHRIASGGSVHGISKACFDFCKNEIDYLRIDTHQDNIPMQNTLRKNQFQRCGIITLADGSERIAFDYSSKNISI